MKKFLIITLMGWLGLSIAATPIQADFIQCPGGFCTGTMNNDLINGTSQFDDILASGGDDLVFAGDAVDRLLGEAGNDILFGGLGSDSVEGGSGNDILFGGPDAAPVIQHVIGLTGNDTTNVFAGETSHCLVITSSTDFDVVNLIGFGPYSVQQPFGQTDFEDDWIYVQDPIAGGDIFIDVDELTNGGTEVINGLPSPNVTIVNAQFGNCVS